MKTTILAALALFASTAVFAQAPVAVENAWARASVQGQSGTGAFMRITAREPLTLVGVSTPVARVAEVHEMKMEGDVMRMRAIPGLELPARKAVELRPGGYHLMLMELRAPLMPETRIPLTLTFRDANGQSRSMEVSVPVAVRPPAGSAAPHKH